MQVARVIKEQQSLSSRVVLHWYDFLCPFCYVAQHRNDILTGHGFAVSELAFQAHPDVPSSGVSVGPRNGPMYTMLEREAKEAGLPLRWPLHLPNTRPALAAAEWTRRFQPRFFPALHSSLFSAHFALSEDIGDQAVIDKHASASGVELKALHAALDDGTAAGFVVECEELGRGYGVKGTPAWFLNAHLISGLRSAADFEWLAQAQAKTAP